MSNYTIDKEQTFIRLVRSRSDLYNHETWMFNKSGDILDYNVKTFIGMTVTVYRDPNPSNNQTYVLTGDDYTNPSNWMVYTGGDVTSVSTALSTEISIRESADISLSTAISSGGGGDGTGVTSLSTSLSTEISIRASADLSLSAAINSVSGSTGSSSVSLHTIANITSDTNLGVLNSGITLGMIYITNTGSTTAYINLGTTSTGNEINPYGLIQINSGDVISITANIRLSNTENKNIYISSSDWTDVELIVEWAEITYANQLGSGLYLKLSGGTMTGGITGTTINLSGYGWAVDWIATSDERLKENILPIHNALNKILNSRGVYFNFINDQTKQQKIGVIAQEIEVDIPEIVINDGYGFKSVSYGNLTALLIEAIKEQNQRIDELERKYETLYNLIYNK